MLCWTPVRIHCHQFAGFCSIVKSVALPRLADALHVFSAAAPAPVFTADFSLCSWRFVNLSHKLLQSLAATWTWQLDVSDGYAALVLVVSPTFTILLFFFLSLCRSKKEKPRCRLQKTWTPRIHCLHIFLLLLLQSTFIHSLNQLW